MRISEFIPSYPPFFSHFLTYLLGAICIRGISFFMLPLIMHKIPPREYGILSLLTAFTAITTALLGLGLRQLLSIEYFHAPKSQQPLLIHDILLIYTLVALPSIVLLWYARTFVIRIIFFNSITSLQFLALVITTFLFFYSELMYQLLQYEQKAHQLALLQCAGALFIATSTFISVVYGNAGITGIIWAQAGATIITTLCAWYYFLRNHTAPTSVHTQLNTPSYYVWYGLPFIPGTIASWLLSSADRWILGYCASLREVGIYAVADLASQLFYTLILQSWAASYLPYIMQRYQQHAHEMVAIEQKNQRIMWITMAGLTCTIILGYPIAHIMVPYLLPVEYQEALRYALILLMGQIFLLGSYFAATLIQYTKHTHFLAIALCIPAFLNIALNSIFTPLWGIMGCSIATLLSYALYFFIIYAYNRKLTYQS